jgi:hypothetical protein
MSFLAKPFFRSKQLEKQFDLTGKSLLNACLNVGETPRKGNKITRLTPAKPLQERFS